MDYKLLVEKNTAYLFKQNNGNFLRLYAPADIALIKKVEGVIGKSLPDDLLEFYSQSDGASDDWFCFNIMRSSDLLEQNYRIRSDYDNLNELLVFSHLDGNMFFYAITSNGYNGIYEWNSITDERVWVANNLVEWIELQSIS